MVHLVHIDGAFDVPAAHRVRDALRAAGPDERVRVDLSRVNEFYAFGIVALFEALARCREVPVELRGLRAAEIERLRSLGLGPAEPAEPGYERAA